MKQRLITALIALPILVLIVLYANQGLFAGIVFIISALALYEFYQMSLPPERRLEMCLSVAAGVTSCLGIVYAFSQTALLLSIVCPFLFLTLVYLFRFQNVHAVSRDLSFSMLGILYVPVLLSHAILLRALPDGRKWVFLVLLVVMMSDSLAYFWGKRFGRHTLYKAVSPNKSLEGSFAGLLGGVLGAAICKLGIFPGLRGVDIALLGLGVGVFSQLGDLVESLLKRSFSVKDSGAMVPGHGGLLDRLDSLLFAFPLTYYYAVWMYP